MSNVPDDHQRLLEAIRAGWSRETSADPGRWTSANPALGQCEVASFVLWEHLGGALVLGRVLVDGEQTEHHYWNRIDDVDFDLTREQFRGHEVIEELLVLGEDAVRAKQAEIRPDLAGRIDLLRHTVTRQLATSD